MKRFNKCFIFIFCFTLLCFPALLLNGFTNSKLNLLSQTVTAESFLRQYDAGGGTVYKVILEDPANGGIIGFDSGGGGGNYINLEPSGSATLYTSANSGYQFVEWNIIQGSENITINNPTSETTSIVASSINDGLTHEITITCTFESIDYTINYTLDGGNLSTPNPGSYTIETATFTLNNPTKEGYVFLGWSGTGIDGMSIEVEITKGSTRDKSFTANWVKKYFLHYSPNGGEDKRENPNLYEEVLHTDKITLSDEFENLGKTLTSWQVEETEHCLEPGVEWDVSVIVSYASHSGATITLKAVWTVNIYNIVYDSNGGTGNTPAQNGKTVGDNITIDSGTDISKTGYAFDYWEIIVRDDETNEIINTYKIYGGAVYSVLELAGYAGVLNQTGATITLTAKWDIITYTINFIDFQGQQFASTTYNITTTTKTLQTPQATQTGYTFNWIVNSTDSDSSWIIGGKFLPGAKSFDNFYGNVTFRGEFIANTYTIKYDINGGTGNLDAFEQQVQYNAGVFVIKTTAEMSGYAEMEHYYILGYSVNGNDLDLTKSYTVAELAGLAGVIDINNSDIIIKLEWQGDDYRIVYKIFNEQTETYEPAGAEWELTPNIHHYGTATILPQPEKIGYTFSGWKLQGVGNVLTALGAYDFTNKEDIELYGKFEINSYDVKFYNDSGGVIKQILMNHGEVYNSEHAEYFIPTKASVSEFYYEFAGWYDGIGESANEITDFTITGNRNFYAKFTSHKQKYTVKFYNGAVPLYENEFEFGADAVYVGETPLKDSTAQNTYEFDGWSLTDGGAKVVTMEVAGATIFYAHFKENVRSYLLQFFDGEGEEVLDAVNLAYGTEVDFRVLYVLQDIPTPEANYEFVGWYDNINCFGDKIEGIVVTQDLQFFAKFNRVINQYTFYFKFYHSATNTEYSLSLAGGANGFIKADYGTVLDYEDLIPEYPAELMQEHYNYSFVGWYDNKNLTGQQVYQFQITENDTFYAKFEIITKIYILSLMDENGNEALFDEISKSYGSSVILAQEVGGNIIYTEAYIPVKESTIKFDYVFVGWYEVKENDRLGGEQQVLEVFMNANKTLYAFFEATNRIYTIKFYDAEGNEANSETLIFGSSVLISSLISNTPQKANTVQFSYSFVGWYDNPDFDGEPITEIALTEEYFNEYGLLPLNVYPKFNESLQYYNVYFRNTEDVLYEQLSVGYGEVAVYAEDEPTKSNDLTFIYTFAGWSKIKFSSNLITDFTILGETTFYACFSKTYINYTLTLYMGTVVFDTVACTYNQRVDLTQNRYKIVRQDNRYIYEFVGWWDNPNFTGNELTFVDLTEDISLYAKFNTREIGGLDRQTILIILACLAGLIILIVAFAGFKSLSLNRSGLKKISRKRIHNIKTEQEQVNKEWQEIQKRIKDIKERNNKNDSDDLKE